MQVRSLGQEDILQEGTPEFLPAEFQTEEPGGLQSMGSQIVRHN